MTKSEKAVKEITNLMKSFGFLADKEKSFKLKDNTIVSVSKLKVGEKITKINEKFEKVALGNGTFIAKQGFKMKVRDGVIKEMFLDETLEDGTEITIEGNALVEGAKVFVVTDDGDIPAPDGDHTLEDGTVVTVKDGVIAEIEGAEPGEGEEDESMEDENKDTEVMAAEDDVKGKTEGDTSKSEDDDEDEKKADADQEKGEEEDVHPDVKKMMEAMEDFLDEMKEKYGKMEHKMKKMQKELDAFKSAPAGSKIKDGKTEKFSSASNDSQIANIMAMRANQKY